MMAGRLVFVMIYLLAARADGVGTLVATRDVRKLGVVAEDGSISLMRAASFGKNLVRQEATPHKLVSLNTFASVTDKANVQHNFQYYQDPGPYSVKNFKVRSMVELFWPKGVPGKVPCLVYSCGTLAKFSDYEETGRHVASHGICVLYTRSYLISARKWKADVERGLRYLRKDAPPNDWRPFPSKLVVDEDNLAVGGHSGGGPASAKAASGKDYVKALVLQHAAALFMNKPSQSEIEDISGKSLILCGTDDRVPKCGCHTATDFWFAKLASRMLVETPTGHKWGAQGEKGDEFEGGYIVAFLKYVLFNDQNAKLALAIGKSGDTVKCGDVCDS